METQKKKHLEDIWTMVSFWESFITFWWGCRRLFGIMYEFYKAYTTSKSTNRWDEELQKWNTSVIHVTKILRKFYKKIDMRSRSWRGSGRKEAWLWHYLFMIQSYSLILHAQGRRVGVTITPGGAIRWFLIFHIKVLIQRLKTYRIENNQGFQGIFVW